MLAIASLLPALVGIGLLVAIVVVIATVGKRHRPDAYGWLLGWAIGTLAWTFLSDVVHLVLPRVVERSETVFAMFSGFSLLGTAVHVGLSLLFIRGFVAIAQPPARVTTEPVGPYR